MCFLNYKSSLNYIKVIREDVDYCMLEKGMKISLVIWFHR